MTAISVANVNKNFRIPLDRSTTLKYRVVHPRSSSRYDNFHALEDVSFDIPEGQFVGIIGHNGCGKSTLLKLLAGIYRPSGGTIAVSGRVSPFLELGVGFNPELTARENIFLNGAVLGLTRQELELRVDDILAFAELEHRADQKVKGFSSGMEVRLAFSVAIQADADILLMDEVLAVGDARFQAKCFDIFARYKRQGRTVVLVTHDLAAVEMYCDRAILLDHGRLITDGPPGEVVARYRRMVGRQIDADAMGATATEEVEATTDQRWGSGEVRVAGVHLLDAAGQQHHTFTSGQPMGIGIGLEVTSQVGELVCGFSIHRSNGFTLAGTNTFICKIPLPCPPAGSALRLDYVMPSLNLLAGTYRVSVAVHAAIGAHVYDEMDQMIEFEVVDESGRTGLFELSGAWSVSERTALPAAVAEEAQQV